MKEHFQILESAFWQDRLISTEQLICDEEGFQIYGVFHIFSDKEILRQIAISYSLFYNIKGVSYFLLFVIYNSKLLRHHIYDKCLRTFSTDKDIGRDSAEGFQTGGSQFPLPCLKAHFCPTDMCHCQTILLLLPFYYQSECLSRTRNQQQSYTDSPRRPSVISVFLETLRYQY